MLPYIALIRAINVGGSGKLAMSDLKAICLKLGFKDVSTYIQSGNVVFRTEGSEEEVAARLDAALAEVLGKAPDVMVRTLAELSGVLHDNPFAAMEPNRVLVSFFSTPLPDDALNGIVAPDGEEAVVRGREIYVHYPIGSGRSKLKLPALKSGTSRNINTVVKLVGLAKDLDVSR
ncbi:DUF1697 domain-containing protein [Rhizobium sp. RU36D]|uniref:DUF1697 domain-containing protein n=1 Tax=Rhizobium sp. RU36D TaxID=1907415 RepID=UPI0009D7C8E9|nr:DUF1697 domain-containing protein [Rhizobium sp. RU36D]SMD19193.1 Uncharacterized conserved protein, DUF1697 family [Rhizobium sp. RU36D]